LGRNKRGAENRCYFYCDNLVWVIRLHFNLTYQVDDYEFFGQRENASKRLREIVVDSFAGYLLEGAAWTRPVPSHFPFKIYKSIQLCVLSRDFVKYVFYWYNCLCILYSSLDNI
jgi:hypothetical protein